MEAKLLLRIHLPFSVLQELFSRKQDVNGCYVNNVEKWDIARPSKVGRKFQSLFKRHRITVNTLLVRLRSQMFQRECHKEIGKSLLLVFSFEWLARSFVDHSHKKLFNSPIEVIGGKIKLSCMVALSTINAWKLCLSQTWWDSAFFRLHSISTWWNGLRERFHLFSSISCLPSSFSAAAVSFMEIPPDARARGDFGV